MSSYFYPSAIPISPKTFPLCSPINSYVTGRAHYNNVQPVTEKVIMWAQWCFYWITFLVPCNPPSTIFSTSINNLFQKDAWLLQAQVRVTLRVQHRQWTRSCCTAEGERQCLGGSLFWNINLYGVLFLFHSTIVDTDNGGKGDMTRHQQTELEFIFKHRVLQYKETKNALITLICLTLTCYVCNLTYELNLIIQTCLYNIIPLCHIDLLAMSLAVSRSGCPIDSSCCII